MPEIQNFLTRILVAYEPGALTNLFIYLEIVEIDFMFQKIHTNFFKIFNFFIANKKSSVNFKHLVF